MKANSNSSGQAVQPTAALPRPRLGRLPTDPTAANRRQRFRILDFANPSGTRSFRVQGMDRQGTYRRENFANFKAAELRRIELETEYLTRQPSESAVRATSMSEDQVRLAEGAFIRLDSDDELPLAVAYWLEHGRNKAVVESPRLDDALTAFLEWLAVTPSMRQVTKSNLAWRLKMFGNNAPNLRVADFTPDTIDTYLAQRKAGPATRDNDRRGISRFFSWCIERPRRWARTNPCHEVRVAQGDAAPPAVLTVAECERLLRCAEKHRGGVMVPYAAVCLFAGLRPHEAGKLAWSQVNLGDGEIRLESHQTKTNRARVVSICPTLGAWLQAYHGKPFRPRSWRKHFLAVKAAAGFSTAARNPWTPDILRHTAVSHHIRLGGSYGNSAEQFGNSEAIIKSSYQGMVSTEQTLAFYSILPAKKGATK
jgi:integrase